LLSEFRYLTAPAATLHRVWAAYGVKSRAQAGDDRVDHTLYTLLLDRQLEARVLYDATATPAAVAHDLDILLRRS
jgi:cytochrome oxidase Cu insertion factor (SCO1/SenC/PrrC family)